MKRTVLWILTIVGPLALAQAKAGDVKGKLGEYGVTLDQIENSLKDADAAYYFKASNTTISKSGDGNDYTSVEVSEFDPRREVGERWKLLSMNGTEPSDDAAKSFEKNCNTTKDDINGKIDRETLKVISEDDNSLVIGFRYEGKSLPKKYKFLADCDATYTIDKASRKLVSASFVNFKPTKVSIIKVPKLQMEMDFVYLDEAEGYHILKEQMDMTVSLLGQEAESSAVVEYTDFAKVK